MVFYHGQNIWLILFDCLVLENILYYTLFILPEVKQLKSSPTTVYS